LELSPALRRQYRNQVLYLDGVSIVPKDGDGVSLLPDDYALICFAEEPQEKSTAKVGNVFCSALSGIGKKTLPAMPGIYTGGLA